MTAAAAAPEPLRFPFSAVVGLEEVKLALVLAAVDPAIGGVLLRGQKGSAKTTLARGLAALLPGPAPFAELPVGASEDRLIGSLDLAAAVAGDPGCFAPGLLAAADGGVLYVDEVNLLPDHLVDVLLDVAASGVNRVEREGISHQHRARFVLVGSMNPEEGELRPQLLDRFGLAVEVAADTDPGRRAEAVRRRLAFDRDPLAFAGRWAGEEADLARRLGAVRPATVPDPLLGAISAVCAGVGAEGLRADLVTARAAAALAAWDGRAEATWADVGHVAPLALAHRRRRTPFEDTGIDADELDRVLRAALPDPPAGPPPPAGAEAVGGEAAAGAAAGGAAAGGGEAAGGGTGGDTGPDGRAPGAGPGPLPGDPAPDPLSDPAPGRGETGADPGAPGAAGHPGERGPVAPLGRPPGVAPLRARRAPGEAGGRRSPVEAARGRLVSDRVPTGAVASVAVGATVRAAVSRRADDPAGPALEPSDVREAVREARAGNLLVLAVDASGSMGAARRMEAAKGAVLGLLLDAYQRRDRVAMVTFGGDDARVVLRPTGSVEVARARLADLATGGRTPLHAGIITALAVATGGADPGLRPLVVLVSDGRATTGPAGADPVAAATEAADLVRRRGVDAVVVDAEDGPCRLGLARQVATAMGARYLTLSALSAGALEGALREALW